MLETAPLETNLIEEMSCDKNNIIRHPVIDYLAMCLLICISGNYVFNFNGSTRTVWVSVLVGFTGLMYSRKQFQISKRLVFVLLSFAFLFGLHWIIFGLLPLQTIAGFFVRILIAYAACCLISDFPRRYINVFFWITIISLSFFFGEHLLGFWGVGIRSFFKPVSEFVGSYDKIHIGIYNFYMLKRNCGIFWEPGAFGGYLLIGLIFLGLSRSSFSDKQFWARFLVLVLGALTTFSTTVYVILPLLLPLFWKIETKNRRISIIKCLVFSLCFLMIESGFYFFYRRAVDQPLDPYYLKSTRFEDHIHGDFLFQKISRQYKLANESQSVRHRSRFDDMIADWEYIKRRPLAGWGIHKSTRYQLHPDAPYESGHGCGLTDYLAKFGLFGFAILMTCLFISCYRVSGGYYLTATWSVGLLLLILLGQNYIRFPLWYVLIFLGVFPAKGKLDACEEKQCEAKDCCFDDQP